MPFISFIEILLANESSLKQNLPLPKASEAAIEEVIPLETTIEIQPFVLEGSVDSFDPLQRAKDLVKDFPREICGTYSPFDHEDILEVIIKVSDAKAIGQIVEFNGQFLIYYFIDYSY